MTHICCNLLKIGPHKPKFFFTSVELLGKQLLTGNVGCIHMPGNVTTETEHCIQVRSKFGIRSHLLKIILVKKCTPFFMLNLNEKDKIWCIKLGLGN